MVPGQMKLVDFGPMFLKVSQTWLSRENALTALKFADVEFGWI
jgi:hypothetical protein